MPPPPPPASLEERVALVQGRLAKQDDAFRQRYLDSFDMSWIYHDSALEGVVYTFEELRSAGTIGTCERPNSKPTRRSSR